MTPEELAALIDSIPEVAEMSRNRAALLDLVTLRPMGKVPEPRNTLFSVDVLIHFEDVALVGYYNITQNKWMLADSHNMDASTALGWTPIPTPLTEGGNHGA